MRSVLAGVGGALLATLAVAGFQTQSVAPAGQTFDGTPQAVVGDAPSVEPAPMTVRCAPGQRAIVRQAVDNGAPVTAAECTGVVQTPATVPADMDLVEMPMPRRATPASYEPAVYQPAPVVYQAPAPRPAPVREAREVKPKRSWKKTALIIGGSAGAGAGIGALTGGKKGALIGAAIGGGAASIYEATKR